MGNAFDVTASVLDIDRNGFYRLKVSIVDMGMYMFGFRAKQSDKGGWWIQPPSTKTPSGWKMNPEFDKSRQLWQEIEKACITAVCDYGGDFDEHMTGGQYSSLLDKATDKITHTDNAKTIPWMDEGES